MRNAISPNNLATRKFEFPLHPYYCTSRPMEWRHLVSSIFVCIVETNPPPRLPARPVSTLLLFLSLPGWSFSQWVPVCRDSRIKAKIITWRNRPHVPTPGHRRAHHSNPTSRETMQADQPSSRPHVPTPAHLRAQNSKPTALDTRQADHPATRPHVPTPAQLGAH